MYGVGPVPSLKGLQVNDTPEAGTVRRTQFVFRDFQLSLVDNPGVDAHAEQKLYTFPEALVFVKGVVTNLTLTKQQIGATNGLSSTFGGLFSLGSVQSAGDATLTSTEADYSASAAIAAAVAGVANAKAVGIAATQFDGTAAAKAFWFNLVINDADQDVTTNPAQVLLNGEIDINWEVIGDK